MSRTLLDIPEELLEEARAIIGPNVSKAETVRQALTALVMRHRQQVAVDWFAESGSLADLNDPAVRQDARR